VPRTGWSQRQRAGLQAQVRKYFSMTRASSIAAMMLTRLEAAGRERQLVADSDELQVSTRCGLSRIARADVQRAMSATVRRWGAESLNAAASVRLFECIR
jgi:hypothetical protein